MPLPSPQEFPFLYPPKAVPRPRDTDPSDTGVEDGKTVVPYIRFSGQATFTAGSARPEITVGEFVWHHKTGKRVTIQTS